MTSYISFSLFFSLHREISLSNNNSHFEAVFVIPYDNFARYQQIVKY